MQITMDFLEGKSACFEGRRWFVDHYPSGGEYQSILDALCADDHVDWALWLLRAAGPTDDVRTADTIFNDTEHLVVSGQILVSGKISVRGCLAAGAGIKAGAGIEAGAGIKAGAGIEAGEGIKAGWGIEAGEGIEAGFSISCKLVLSAPLRVFAGLCIWKIPTREEQEIRCGTLANGTVAYGELIETDKSKQETPCADN